MEARHTTKEQATQRKLWERKTTREKRQTLQTQVAEEGEAPGECSQIRTVLSPLQDASTNGPPPGLHATLHTLPR